MAGWRYRVILFVMVPAILAAAVFLGYTTWLTASRYTQLGEQTIAENTLLLVREKVDTIERYVIRQDNAAFGLVNLEELLGPGGDPELLDERWLPVASELTPSMEAIVVIDATGEVVAAAARDGARAEREFVKVLTERLLPEMDLTRLRRGRLKHLHHTVAGRSDLLSYIRRSHRGRRYYVVARHDTEAIVREELSDIFDTEEGKQQYNIVDQDNRRVHGPSLANAGDYLVGLRFPTTLYNWRLQIAPKQAPRLEAQGRSRRRTEIALLAVALVVIVLGVGFLLYAAAKERRLAELKGDFIANVSHELKTPLSVVRMFGELLLTDRVRTEEKKKQYLEIILRESERLSSLIENVLDFSALERGKQTYAFARGDLEPVVARAIEAFRYRVEREGVDVDLEVVGDVPEVEMDEQAIVLALNNLLDNAVKYGDRTPITVTLEKVRDFVQVRVRDHGPGIPETAQRRVFERFYRSDRDQEVRGSGIGLSLVMHIAQAHGGRAWATNAGEGTGAVVAFTLPALEPEEEPEAPAEDPPAAAE
jgi:two-component system phosphate regulon sensor histidine kinase PhoR